MADGAMGSHPQLADVMAWLASGPATRIAQRRLDEHRLFVPTQEVLDTTLERIWKSRLRRPSAEPIDDIARYCAIVIRNVVRDMVRGFDGVDAVDDANFERLAVEREALGRGDDVVAGASGGRDDAIRAALEASTALESWVLSAALTYVTLSEFPDLEVHGAPRPLAGARPDQARMWPSLWLAGMRTGIFPSGGGHDAAQRQRLTRAAAKVRAAIERAAAAAWPDEGRR